ncbi:MAG: NAD(P)/FAD-dependent oxidoreductase [Pararhodobacter sp.]
MSENHANLWHATCRETVAAPPLDGVVTADLAVVGGGFTGCAAALRAAGMGASVALIEAHDIGHGGSGRNVGLVNAGLWLPPDAIRATMGEDAGARLIELLGAAPQRVFDLIERHGIDCEARRNGTLHLAHSPAGLRDLQSRLTQMQALGAPVSLLGQAETARRLGSAIHHGALHDARAGTVQPLALCRGLARAAGAAGARLHGQSAALSLRHEGGQWRVLSARGEIRAPALLLASNAYHLRIEGLPAPQIVPVHYFQMATTPLPPALCDTILPGGEGCWDTAMVMSSYRTDAAGRLIIGAIGRLDHPGSGAHRGWARRRLGRVFPALRDVALEHAWHGRIAMTGDHIPKLQQIGPRALAAFGYSGRGIGPGVTFGTMAAEALLNETPEALPVVPVRAHAEALTGLREVCFESGAVAMHLVSDRL